MQKKLLFLLLFLTTLSSFAQKEIYGMITNQETQEPLAFVNIILKNNPTQGTISDIDGKFSLSLDKEFTQLQLSYIGFETKTIEVTSNDSSIFISLKPSEEKLEEVLLNTGNPAIPIIKKVIAKREENHPENLPEFTHDYYNKVIFDLQSDGKEIDSAFNAVFKGGHILMMESITKKEFKYPRLTNETVVANKVSGFKNPIFTAIATNMQPFSFYDEVIELLDMHFLNPISKGALNKYDYKLKETLVQNNDTIHLISFEPQAGKNIEGLKGLLYINTKNYAIQNVIASPADEMKIDLKIQQQYQYLPEEVWFPEQLNYSLKLSTDVGGSNDLIIAEGKSYIRNVNLQPNLSNKDFSATVLKIDDEAPKKDSLYWQNHRVIPLNEKESITYRVVDSLGKEFKVDKIISYLNKLPQGKIPVGKFDLDITHLIRYNKHEGYRLGLGLYTNEKLIKDVELGGYFGYGFKDYKWKYGFSAKYMISKNDDIFIKAAYQDDIQEIGSYGLSLSEEIFNGLRDFMIEKVDHIQKYSFSGGFRSFKYLLTEVQLNQSKITPLNNYAFNSPDYSSSPFHHTSASIKLRYAYGERLLQTPFQKISLGTKFPVLTLQYTRGFEDVLGGDFNYQKIEARIEQNVFLKNFGKTTYRLQAGYIDQVIPRSLLFTGEGSYDDDFPIVVENTFQTMLPYEFLSDRYIDVFLSHNFGSLLFKSGKFNPEIILHHNTGWGGLSDKYTLYNFKTKEDIYLESGLELARVLKFNYLDLGYITFGAGAFYRYGSYELESFNDNIAFKLNIGFSFN
ncbi:MULTISPECIES: DUF5686 and carboxypeptidase-like regulatory domain-containing protein [Mesonia]|uniref:Uncharacterized protein n=1 Tax=Mesonia oceanica TaxID=2687242 RepID=A0AC61Y6J1_9FLAO|nr:MULTISPECIES: DUF5686 and carboxypeptidase-like regulatory domain-containing protein [Mesonia]MAN26321.1 hypothetical protein [Mesonia sp.]MAQ42263.1 hypothetical protein [Mesonia sp.]MBJ98549.1 hypothetical protein [Flavobacteriaceae bacterium]VVV00036.1 hypothetical protein FVB9532_01297 [Mesonia oceanica]|tara:strand:- start:5397 stop:7775 length:2379 start_codon:yes stop_codon:yes gene_type:complete